MKRKTFNKLYKKVIKYINSHPEKFRGPQGPQGFRGDRGEPGKSNETFKTFPDFPKFTC